MRNSGVARMKAIYSSPVQRSQRFRGQLRRRQQQTERQAERPARRPRAGSVTSVPAEQLIAPALIAAAQQTDIGRQNLIPRPVMASSPAPEAPRGGDPRGSASPSGVMTDQ